MGDDVQVWRVLDGAGGERAVPVRVEGASLLVGDGPGPRAWTATVSPRFAVASLAVSMGWPIAEIRGPSEATTEEQVTAARRAAARRGMLDGYQFAMERAVPVIDGATGKPAVDWIDATAALGAALAATQVQP